MRQYLYVDASPRTYIPQGGAETDNLPPSYLNRSQVEQPVPHKKEPKIVLCLPLES